MSLKDALLKHKRQIDDNIAQQKIAKMLSEQQELLSKYEQEKKLPRVNYTWDSSILANGGTSYYTTTINGVKRRLRVSVTNVENDVVLRYHCRLASDERFSVSAKTYKDAQQVVDELFGVGMYLISGSVI